MSIAKQNKYKKLNYKTNKLNLLIELVS